MARKADASKVEEESLQERQENEMEVLKAIFLDDLRDLRVHDVWKVWRPPELEITLTPLHSMSGQNENHVKVDLYVKCMLTYPNVAPEFELKNSIGLSLHHLLELQQELKEKSQKLKGEVMILELAQHIQNFLHSHNKPAPKSFYEEMLTRKKQQEEKEAQQLHRLEELRKIKEEKQWQTIQEEVQKKQEALREERRQRREQNKRGCSPASSGSLSDSQNNSKDQPSLCSTSLPTRSGSVSRRRLQDTSESSEGCGCEHYGTLSLHFNNKCDRYIQRAKCMGHSTRGSVVYAGVDTITGDMIAIREWTLKWRNREKKVTFIDDSMSTEIANCMKQITSVEQELNSLQKLKHANLVHYQAIQYIHSKDAITVYVLQDFIHGSTLASYLSESLPLDIELVRHYATGVVQALEYLHRNNVVHKDLRDTSIFIENSGLIRVGDYSIEKRLMEIHQSFQKEKPDTFSPTFGRGGKKSDIYRFGVLLLSLLRGEYVSDLIPVVPSSLPEDLTDFLSGCLSIDEHKRYSAEQLLEHRFLKSPVEKGHSPLKSGVAAQEKSEEKEELEPEIDIPFLHSTSSKGQSRIQSEFQVLKWLGKGGFGDVLKVRNKLDGGIYAIKRIHLNPKNKQLNRKITREVKLLSRLNHENVVRYYNSWIETSVAEPCGGVENESSLSRSSEDAAVEQKKSSTLGISDEVEKLAPPLKDSSVEWSISHETKSSVLLSPGSSSSSSEDSFEEEDWFGRSFLPRSDSSDSVVFESDAYECKPEESKGKSAASLSQGKVDSSQIVSAESQVSQTQFMYIQMEYCEKSTLRNAIDDKLYQDQQRMWRLFREIIDGLVHIHQQGMIHRDLKPVNIFLDFSDHVKIGDFGLATTNILARPGISVTADIDSKGVDTTKSDNPSFITEPEEENLTGRVGTALYVAPELCAAGTKTIYSQKVDIYSLGIIFFEMCHPLTTGMERVKVLLNLRSPEVTLPPEFDESVMFQQAYIIQWLLNHDPTQRPTSVELLQSDYLPPPQLEEAELQEMVRHTLSNPQSKAYKYLVASCFKQEFTTAEDITYDMDILRGSTLSKNMLSQAYVKESIAKVFERHGAVYVNTPLLMPKTKLHEKNDVCVRLMTHGGGIVSITHDLRVPFARFVTKNNITYLRRYCIDRVYREKRVFGFHPRELWECAFDIVTPTPGGLVADAEVLAVVWDVMNEFPPLRLKNYFVRLNHSSLLKAILIHCGIAEEKHDDIYNILNESRVQRFSKFQVQTQLVNLSLSDQAVDMLYNFIEVEGQIGKVVAVIRGITKRKGPATSLAKQGLNALQTIICHAEALGVKCPVVVAPGMVHNVHHFSGMMCQFVCEVKKRHHRGALEVIAAGGRYDNMILLFREVLGVAGAKEINQSAVGISISLDKIVSSLNEGEVSAPLTAVDVVVCSLGNLSLTKEKAAIVKDLWAAGHKTLVTDSLQSLEEIQDYCQNRVTHIVILKDTETGTVRVRTWEKDRFLEKKIPVAELVEHLQKMARGLSEGVDSSQSSVMRSDSSKSADTSAVSASSNINVNYSFLTEVKLRPNIKRQYESQMVARLTPVLQNLSIHVPVEVLGVEYNGSVLKTLAAYLELDGSVDDFDRSIGNVVERHQRYKKSLKKVCDELHDLKFEKNIPIIVLYGLNDNSFKVLM